MGRSARKKTGIDILLEQEGFRRTGEETTWTLGVPHAYEREAFNGTPPTRLAIMKRKEWYEITAYTIPYTDNNRFFAFPNTLAEAETEIKKYLRKRVTTLK